MRGDHPVKSQTVRTLRPVDLAREHGISTQAVRNHERDGFIPPAERTRSGYRVYTELHAAALRAYLSLVRAYGHATAGQIMTALHHDRLDDALTAVDRGHDQLLRDRQTLDAVRAAVDHLTGAPGAVAGRPEVLGADAGRVTGPGPLSVGELARRLRVTPATLRNWEAAGVLAPGGTRSPATASSALPTSATPNWPTSSGAAATRCATSPPWSGRSARPAAPTRWPPPWTTGAASSPPAAWPCSTRPPTSAGT